MFWDGSRWVEETTPKPLGSPPRSRRRAPDVVATAVMVVGLVALLIPVVGVSASPMSRLVTDWSDGHSVWTLSETSTKIAYTGAWSRRYNTAYRGGYVKATMQTGATATTTFTAMAVAWAGPVGPTRGKAKVYIDGV